MLIIESLVRQSVVQDFLAFISYYVKKALACVCKQGSLTQTKLNTKTTAKVTAIVQ